MNKMISAKTVSQSLWMLTGRYVGDSLAEGMVEHSGSRQELLAHLIVDWRILSGHDDAQKAVERQVGAVRFGGTLVDQGLSPERYGREVPSKNRNLSLDRFIERPSLHSVLEILADMRD